MHVIKKNATVGNLFEILYVFFLARTALLECVPCLQTPEISAVGTPVDPPLRPLPSEADAAGAAADAATPSAGQTALKCKKTPFFANSVP